MHCFVCTAACHPFITKDFGPPAGPVEYVCCPDCGCVFAETLLRWDDDRWAAWCLRYHGPRAGTETDPDDPHRLPRLQRQAQSLRQARRQGWLAPGPWLDYGSGDGHLADLLQISASGEPGIRIDRFDRYLDAPHQLDETTVRQRQYGVVLNTAMFEHVRQRAELDAIVARIRPGGALALHTLVRSEIPADPSWFYLLPVHTVMFTNEGMHRLFAQWNLKSSAYDVPARLWYAFDGSLPDAVPDDWPQNPDGFTAYWP